MRPKIFKILFFTAAVVIVLLGITAGIIMKARYDIGVYMEKCEAELSENSSKSEFTHGPNFRFHDDQE